MYASKGLALGSAVEAMAGIVRTDTADRRTVSTAIDGIFISTEDDRWSHKVECHHWKNSRG